MKIISQIRKKICRMCCRYLNKHESALYDIILEAAIRTSENPIFTKHRILFAHATNSDILIYGNILLDFSNHTIKILTETAPEYQLDEYSNHIDEEELIGNRLVSAYHLFQNVKQTHPSDITDFVDGIHKCQYVLMAREARRSRPDLYPDKSKYCE